MGFQWLTFEARALAGLPAGVDDLEDWPAPLVMIVDVLFYARA